MSKKRYRRAGNTVLIIVFGSLLVLPTLRQQEPEPEPSPSRTAILVGRFELEGTITVASTTAFVSPTSRSGVDKGLTGTIDIRIDKI